jgi:hypothetical protein
MIIQKRNICEQKLTQRNEELRMAQEENVALMTKNRQIESQMKELKKNMLDTVSAVNVLPYCLTDRGRLVAGVMLAF